MVFAATGIMVGARDAAALENLRRERIRGVIASVVVGVFTYDRFRAFLNAAAGDLGACAVADADADADGPGIAAISHPNLAPIFTGVRSVVGPRAAPRIAAAAAAACRAFGGNLAGRGFHRKAALGTCSTPGRFSTSN